jgi:hypothetical protein
LTHKTYIRLARRQRARDYSTHREIAHYGNKDEVKVVGFFLTVCYEIEIACDEKVMINYSRFAWEMGVRTG